ncbi:hypothetical protein SADUNF_Sadunf08G0168100 [Salix dunnii]|uniref:Uncharacterized protein n=1 Tax=Salix dunnii TaxID=1413687 RepID=A0A835JUZ9_9ROSI|nr:hypothetical protein SADUNF_Sadunf08G0168100 [Salix dunnii]
MLFDRHKGMTKLTVNLFFIVALVFSDARKCGALKYTCRQMGRRPGRPGLVAKCNLTRCLCLWDC